MRTDILEETADVAKRAVDRLSHRIKAHCDSGQPIEIAEEFRVMTLQVIGELILSLTPAESARVFPELYLPIVEEANRRVWAPWRAYLPTASNRHFHKTVAELNEYVSALIEARWAKRAELVAAGGAAPAADILDRVLSAQDPAAWGPDTVRQIRDEVKTFLLAGHETSASMLTWSVYELSQNKGGVLAKALAEGRAVFGEGLGRAKATKGAATGGGGGPGVGQYEAVPLPHKDEVDKLEYTVRALKESLRKYTLVPMVVRVCAKDDVMDGHPVPAGTKIFINMKCTHTNPRLWPDPDEFKPDRFAEDFDRWNFNAFINGPRNCLGQHLALLEARIVLALLLQRFEFSAANDECGECHPYMVPTCPKNGMWLNVKERTSLDCA
jgi:cytochrome P450